MVTEAGSYLRLFDSNGLRLKDLLGPITRVKKKKKKLPGCYVNKFAPHKALKFIA